MSNAGQAILTIGGTIVGAAFGNPQLGFLLGSLVGSVAFPTQLPTVKGPRLEDAKFQTSTLGSGIPLVWGTYILAGQVLWRSPFLERKVKEKAGGKGGPEQTSVHYEYRVNVAIGLCGRPPTRDAAIAGIRRIWADTKLIYDASKHSATRPVLDPDSIQGGLLPELVGKLAASMAMASNFDVYLGDETQEPDSTIETWEGVDNVPAYKSLAYIVFRDFELADYGNRVPNFRVEVFTDGVTGDAGIDLYSNDYILPWIDGYTRDPRSQFNGHEYNGSETGGTWTDSLEDALTVRETAVGRELIPETIWRWSKSSTPTTISWCDGEDANDKIELNLWFNSLDIPGDSCDQGYPCASAIATHGIGNVWHARDKYWVVTAPGVPESFYFNGYSQPGSFDCGSGRRLQYLSDTRIRVRRTSTPPDGCAGLLPVPGADGYCVTADGIVMPEIEWTLTAGSWHMLRNYQTSGQYVTSYPLNPARPSTHAEYNDQAFWEAAYAEAVAEGLIEGGLVYGVDYPESQSYGYVGELVGEAAEPNTIPLSEIVADICESCGLTAYDVSDLETTEVHGYAIVSPMSGKDAIDPLRPFGYFDGVESGFEYKFVQRGQASVMTIDTADLAARIHTEERPSAMSVVRGQEKELPQLVRGHFIDLARDGDPGQAEQQRQSVNSVNTADIQVPVVMPVERGQAMVDTVLFERWIGRNTYQCSLPFKYAALEPTDCITVTVDGTAERMRLTNVDTVANAVLNLSAIRDDASVYTGLDIVGENIPAETIPAGGVPSPTELILLELPSLRAQDNDCGYYAATRGLLTGWPGAILYKATSPSGTFRQVAWTSVAATIGIVTESAGVDTVNDSGVTGTALVDTGGIDQSTVIRVQLYSGTFESISQEDLLAGENLIAVGEEGDWELLRFQLAVLGSDGIWELSGLLRAQSGTTQRSILEGERVVLMTGPGIMRIDESSAAEGVSRVVRAVTSGTSLEDADDHYITTTCLSRSTSVDAAELDFNSVISQSVGEAPLSPSCGDVYIVGSGTPDTDDPWVGHEGDIAIWDCSTLAWEFIDPIDGKPILVEDEDLHYYWNGSYYSSLGGGGGFTDLTGDVTASGSGSVAATIANDAVTYAKMQNVSATSRLIGRKTASAGDPEEVTLSEALDFIGSAAQGDILYRGASAWARLGAGSAGQFLKTFGAAANPAWSNSSAGGAGALDPANRFDMFDDCDGITATGGEEWDQELIGANSGFYASGSAGHPGVFQMDTGTTATGIARAIRGSNVATDTTQRHYLLGSDPLVAEFLVSVVDLPTATQTYSFACGLRTSFSGANLSLCAAIIVYDGGAAKWRLTTRNEASTLTDVNSTGAAPTAGAWHHVKLTMTSSSVTLDVDGVTHCTNSTALPDGAMAAYLQMSKSVGSTSRIAKCDFVWIHQDFSSSRF